MLVTRPLETADHFASERGHPHVVKLLLDSGSDVSLKDKWGLTALHRASKNGHKETVQCLVASGSDSNCKDFWGYTDLYIEQLRMAMWRQ